jgi:hypothetical protein
VIGTILSCTLSGNEFFGASTFIVILLYVSFHFILFLFNVSRASSSSSFVSTGDTAFSIAAHNFIVFHNIGATDVHASTFKFSTSSIISSTVHVIILTHVIVFPVSTHTSSDDDDELHHHDLFFHCATNSAPDNGIVAGKLGFHHLNIYHHLVGLLGAVRFDSYFHVIGETSLHHLLSNVISYTFLSYCTLTTVLPSHLMTFCVISLAVNHVYSFATACVISSVVHSSVSLSLSSYELSFTFSTACTTVYSIHDFGSHTALYSLSP